MTVSTIPGIPGDVKRALDNTSRAAKPTPSETPKAASLPQDSIAGPNAPAVSMEAAIIQTQVQNREAARATLSDEDFKVLEAAETPQEQIAANPKPAIAAQTNKLPVDLVQLASE